MLDHPARSALFTDLYELTMAQAYHTEHMNQTAVFELYYRGKPENRNYILAAGLDDVLDYLENWHFSDDDLAYLKSLGTFKEPFLDALRDFRFTGDVFAVPEGTIVFDYEPILQVAAPVMEAQIVETFLINQVHFQSLAATKVSRVVCAAKGKTVVDFGSRRAHGLDAAIKVAKATYIAGAAGSSNVLAGKMYGLPVYGTMAHSYVQAHEDEADAFRAFVDLYPDTTVLVDTYDTLEGVAKTIELSRRLGDRFRVSAIRFDSGDLVDLTKKARKMLDNAGMTGMKIFLSGGLDEYAIDGLLKDGAVFDGLGVGTKMVVSSDLPTLDMVYKMVEYDGRPRTKLAAGKEIYPGRKQVFRREKNGMMAGDVIARNDESLNGEPLIQPVMKNGRRLEAGRVDLEAVRIHARNQLGRLPEDQKSIWPADEPYPVEISRLLQARLDDWKASVQGVTR